MSCPDVNNTYSVVTAQTHQAPSVGCFSPQLLLGLRSSEEPLHAQISSGPVYIICNKYIWALFLFSQTGTLLVTNCPITTVSLHMSQAQHDDVTSLPLMFIMCCLKTWGFSPGGAAAPCHHKWLHCEPLLRTDEEISESNMNVTALQTK